MFIWDEAKRAANIARHGIDFRAVEAFDFAMAMIEIDDREDYGELREIAYGLIGVLVCVLVFTRSETDDGDEEVRVISLRNADRKERKRYGDFLNAAL